MRKAAGSTPAKTDLPAAAGASTPADALAGPAGGETAEASIRDIPYEITRPPKWRQQILARPEAQRRRALAQNGSPSARLHPLSDHHPTEPVGAGAPVMPAAPASERPAIIAAPSVQTKVWPRAWVIGCETTGLTAADRIVTLGAVEMSGDYPTGKGIYLIFDPGRNSHPAAARVHGWPDWVLRHQAFFSEAAAELHATFSAADLLVAHNAAFDLNFLERDFRDAGLGTPAKSIYCTMRKFRDRFPGERSGLDQCLRRKDIVLGASGRQFRGKVHNAFHDAVCCAEIYAWLLGRKTFPTIKLNSPHPTNLRPAPPMPDGILPARKRRPRKVQGRGAV